MKPSGRKVIIILACGVLAISTAAIFIRLALAVTTTTGVGFSLFLASTRLNIAALILLPTYPTWSRTQITRGGLYYGTLAGLFLALHFAFWITSLSFTSIAASTTLVTTNPIWIAIISWLCYQEKPTKLTSLGILLAIGGGIIITLSNSEPNVDIIPKPWLGNLLALCGSLMASLYLLSGRSAKRQGLTTQAYIAIAYTTAAVILLPLPLLWGESYFNHPPIIYLYSLLMAIFPQLIGHTSFNWAMRHLSPTLVSLVILLEPLGSTTLGLIFLGETPANLVILGGLIVLSGVAIAIISSN